jgi:hypothetical protein
MRRSLTLDGGASDALQNSGDVFDLVTKPRAVNSMVRSAAIDLRQCVMAKAAQIYSAKAAKSVSCVIVRMLLKAVPLLVYRFVSTRTRAKHYDGPESLA